MWGWVRWRAWQQGEEHTGRAGTPTNVFTLRCGCHLPLLQAFLPSLLAGLHLETLMHGNITATQATALARQLHAALGGGQLAADQRPAERCVQLPKGCDMLHR